MRCLAHWVVCLLGTLLACPSTSPASLIERLFDAFNRHDVAALQDLYAPSASLRSSDFCTARTGRDVTRTYAALFRAVPDIRDEPDAIIVDGDRAAVRFRAVGSGLALRLVTFFRFEHGRIIEDETVFDTGGRVCEP